MTSTPPAGRPVALVTGVSRSAGIGAAVARRLTADGFEVVAAGWRAYDRRMQWGADDTAPVGGAYLEIDFTDSEAAAALIPAVVENVGAVTALVMCHCESLDSDIAETTIESFDRHMAVNARATWLLIRAFAAQFAGPAGAGRIIAFTSDHTVGNVPYGASKAAMDRIVLAAAVELADLGVTANVINPGATDTGWMTPEIEATVREGNLQGRVGAPDDAARLVSFLCSPEGGWINRQLLHSDGGRR